MCDVPVEPRDFGPGYPFHPRALRNLTTGQAGAATARLDNRETSAHQRSI